MDESNYINIKTVFTSKPCKLWAYHKLVKFHDCIINPEIPKQLLE